MNQQKYQPGTESSSRPQRPKPYRSHRDRPPSSPNSRRKDGTSQPNRRPRRGSAPNRPSTPKPVVPLTPEQQKLVTHITETLQETTAHPIRQIQYIVARLGNDLAQEMLEAAQYTQQHGGIMTTDKSRPRTLGGIFFFLIKQRLINDARLDDIRVIFPRRRRRKTATPAPDPVLPPMFWSDRGKLIAKARTATGKVNSIRVSLRGHFLRTVERQGFTLATMKQTTSFVAVPQGIPIPKRPPTTTYIIYISNKQWRKVKPLLRDSDDVACIEGIQIYDEEYDTITVFATQCTTQGQLPES